MKDFKDYLRYVAQYSFFDPNIGIIYEKDNPYKRFILVCLYIHSRSCFWPSLLELAFWNNACANRGLSKIINMQWKDNVCIYDVMNINKTTLKRKCQVSRRTPTIFCE